MAEFEDAGGLPHFHGHRDRLRARFREQGAAALADYELLEMALFRALPRGDTKPLAKALLKHFGTLQRGARRAARAAEGGGRASATASSTS